LNGIEEKEAEFIGAFELFLSFLSFLRLAFFKNFVKNILKYERAEKDLVPLQSKFFPAKFFFCNLKKGFLAGKNLLIKRVKLLCKEGYSVEKLDPFVLLFLTEISILLG
jgi:hypothetical protein